MGDLEPYMDEAFIRKAFDFHDEKVVSVKIIRNKVTGQTLGYGFVEFRDGIAARDAMLRLNGKPIPGVPTRRFKLNHASYGKDSSAGEYSLFVGELTEDVDDLALFNAFKKYTSCRSAKVVMNNGKSRGYGFVRFSSESDQDKALIEMQNFCGLGYKPIRVSLAIPKRYTVDGNLILGTGPETSSSLIPSGIPDPFTAAVAAAVSGSSVAQAEYYQAYQQYYQQYYAAQYAQYYPKSSTAGEEGAAGSGTAAAAGAIPTAAGNTDASSAAYYGYGFQTIPNTEEASQQEFAPDPNSLSASFDRPRHVEDIDECFLFLESSRWNFSDPSLGLLVPVHP
ncbi:tRNA selenocysteine 1-associated protein 1 [Sparganum proliferum]